jgi:TPR repeat protein
MPRLTNKSKASELFTCADQQNDLGHLRSAFRLMLAAAKLGDVGAQVNVGNYYVDGKGVRRSRASAFYWYKRAYRRGDSGAAHNIGVFWRNEGDFQRALYWFSRAVRLGDEESNLDIGKHFLHNEKNPRRAIAYFKRVKSSGWVSEAGVEEAAELLRLATRCLEARHRS